MEYAAYVCLLVSAFAGGFSLPAGRVMLGASLVLVLIDRIRQRRRPFVPLSGWIGLAFVAVAVLATALGENRALGMSRLDKLAWFVGLPVAATLLTSSARLRGLLWSVAAGSGVLAVRTLVWHPLRARNLVESGQFTSLGVAIKHCGSMADSQRLMLGILAATGLMFVMRSERRRTEGLLLLMALLGAGFVMQLKRGAWFCGLLTLAVFVGIKTRWRYVLAMGGAVLLVALAPPVRARLMELRNEFQSGGGGRVTMWTEVAPELVRRHPWLGIGYRSLTNEMMKEIAPHVESDRDHLHSNPIQILVATGCTGLALYLVWMSVAVVDGLHYCRRAARDGESDGIVAAALLLMLTALLLNGFVEYNFGDGEIVLFYGFIMGGLAAGRRRVTSSSETSSGRFVLLG